MSLIEIFSITLIHWFADFVLQTDKQAKGKSKDNYELISHTLIYSVVFFFIGIMYCILFNIPYINAFYFYLITFVFHTITDYYTSRLNSKLWAEGRIHDFLYL